MKLEILLIALTLLVCSSGAGKDSCFDCHRVMEGMSLKYTNDVHFARAINCADCHGGDPNESDQNISMHASRGFKLRVQRKDVPAFCGSCHSDANVMGKYSEQPRVDQLAKYQTGVHGKLLAAGRKRAAECGDCHGVHDTRVVNDPLSMASPQRISKTCARCHAETFEAYVNTQHGRRFNSQRRPGCTVCHSSHATEPATLAMLTGPTSVCAPCHKPGSKEIKVAEDMAQVLAGLEAAGPESKDALTRARVAVHGLNLVKLKKAAEPVSSTPNPDEK